MDALGRKRWAIAEGYIPGWSHGPEPAMASHETACLLNTSDDDAHGHCHQTSILGMDADRTVLSRLGLDYEVLDSGCCGMAGSFGFEEGHYEVSTACAERRLLPAARDAHAEGKLVITSGYSCREQVDQLADIRPVHTHEVLRAAFTGGDFAEQLGDHRGLGGMLRANWGAAAAAAVATAGTGALAAKARRLPSTP